MKELITALIKAKTQFKPIKKDASNPFFKSKYLSLDGLLDAVESALLSNGLILVQTLDGNSLVTTLNLDRQLHTQGVIQVARS